MNVEINGESSKMSRRKIAIWTVDEDALQRYIHHIYQRIKFLDDRDVQVKEDERTILHNKVLVSAEPSFDITPERFATALDNYIALRCKITDPLLVEQ